MDEGDEASQRTIGVRTIASIFNRFRQQYLHYPIDDQHSLLPYANEEAAGKNRCTCMTMTFLEQCMTIGMVVLGTMMTRFIPFLLFPAGRSTPKYVQYLGKVLPAAALGLLVIYSMKDVRLLSGNHGIPELLSVTVVALLHIWRRNMFLSIASGTIVYMFFIQMVF